MKKHLLLVLIGLMLFASCSKDEGTTLQQRLRGKWVFDNEACTSQKQYSEIYKNTYPDATIDEAVYYNPGSMHYGYWYFSDSNSCSFFYQYKDGRIREDNVIYDFFQGKLYVGATAYKIIELNNEKLTTQTYDTVCFYGENYEKHIAWIRTDTYIMNKE